jgi:hypothetical protein
VLSIRAPLIRDATDNAGGPKSFAAALDADKCEIWVGATCQISASCALCRRRHPQKVGACCSFHLDVGKDAPSSSLSVLLPLLKRFVVFLCALCCKAVGARAGVSGLKEHTLFYISCGAAGKGRATLRKSRTQRFGPVLRRDFWCSGGSLQMNLFLCTRRASHILRRRAAP